MGLSPRCRLGNWVVLLALATLPAVGCGSRIATVSGKVLYNNKPLKGGRVTFVGSDGKPAAAEINEDGTYTMDKAPLGEVKIAVETEWLRRAANRPRNIPPGMKPGGFTPPDPAALAKRYVWIPEQYADPQKSGKTYTVKPGKQEHDIILEGGGGPPTGKGPRQ